MHYLYLFITPFAKFQIFYCILYMTAADQGYNYDAQEESSALSNLESESKLRSTKETEFLTYTAPEDDNDIRDAKYFASLLQPQRVIFIKNPENKLFSLTAEQLEKQQSLNIYVLQRQFDYADQLKDAKQRVAFKPNVQFVKYRTPEDIEKAKEAIYKDFESIPGTSKYHQNHQTPLYEFDSGSHQLQSVQQKQDTQNSVIFEVLKRPTTAPTMDSKDNPNDNKANDSKNVTDYLPPKLN